jgi:hypothetical protein
MNIHLAENFVEAQMFIEVQTQETPTSSALPLFSLTSLLTKSTSYLEPKPLEWNSSVVLLILGVVLCLESEGCPSIYARGGVIGATRSATSAILVMELVSHWSKLPFDGGLWCSQSVFPCMGACKRRWRKNGASKMVGSVPGMHAYASSTCACCW